MAWYSNLHHKFLVVSDGTEEALVQQVPGHILKTCRFVGCLLLHTKPTTVHPFHIEHGTASVSLHHPIRVTF